MPTKIISCAEPGCYLKRVFSEKDQEYYKQMNFYEPRYCKHHTEIKRQEREAQKNSPFKLVYDNIKKEERGKNRFHGDGKLFNKNGN